MGGRRVPDLASQRSLGLVLAPPRPRLRHCSTHIILVRGQEHREGEGGTADPDSALPSSLPPPHAAELSPPPGGGMPLGVTGSAWQPQQGQSVDRARQATSPLLITSQACLSGGQRLGEEVWAPGAFLAESQQGMQIIFSTASLHCPFPSCSGPFPPPPGFPSLIYI